MLMQGDEMPRPFDPRRILYLDTETTGLGGGAGTVAFEVGLGYLTLSRSAATLSGGESQRIRLATQIGSSPIVIMFAVLKV